MRASARVVLATLTGALVGTAIAAVWWLRVDARTCLGGCDGTPPGDLTLYVGAMSGAAFGSVLWLAWRRTRRG